MRTRKFAAELRRADARLLGQMIGVTALVLIDAYMGASLRPPRSRIGALSVADCLDYLGVV
jgi:hypothetical protein